MPDRAGWRFSALVNLGLLAAVLIVFTACVVLGSGPSAEESFVGTDSAAVSAIEDSGYRPWFTQLFAPPSAEVESGLFAVQAALGAGVFGYALGALRRKRK